MTLTEENVLNIKNWFEDYTQKYRSLENISQYEIDVKYQHSKRVCEECLVIAESLGLSSDELHLAEIIGLLHDVGRFEQHVKYKTFSDLRSEDHALLGIKILKNEDILSGYSVELQDLIFNVIKNHNRREIDQSLMGDALMFTKILRDADKVDLLFVLTKEFLEYKQNSHEMVLFHNLPDNGKVSERLYNDLLNGNVGMIEDVKSLSDFKLIIMGLVFDVNFGKTFIILNERQYLEKIKSVLPADEMFHKLYEKIRSFLNQKLS